MAEKRGAKTARLAPIRISGGAYREARRLLETASLRGWSALGIERTDPPTLVSLVEEAIRLLARHVRPARKEA